MTTTMPHWKRWLVIGVGFLVLAVVGGPYAYIHLVEGPAPDYGTLELSLMLTR
jgi:hypothetical protein